MQAFMYNRELGKKNGARSLKVIIAEYIMGGILIVILATLELVVAAALGSTALAEIFLIMPSLL